MLIYRFQHRNILFIVFPSNLDMCKEQLHLHVQVQLKSIAVKKYFYNDGLVSKNNCNI